MPTETDDKLWWPAVIVPREMVPFHVYKDISKDEWDTTMFVRYFEGGSFGCVTPDTVRTLDYKQEPYTRFVDDERYSMRIKRG